MRKTDIGTKINIGILIYTFIGIIIFITGSRRYNESGLMWIGTIIIFSGLAILWYSAGLTVYEKKQRKIARKKFLIAITIPYLIFIGAFLISQTPYFTIKKEVYKASKELGVNLSKVNPHMGSIYSGYLFCSVDIYSDNFSELPVGTRNEYLSELRSIRHGHSLFNNWLLEEDRTIVHSNGQKYNAENKKTNTISNNNNSSGTKKCINCNGTGTVKYYYGSSDLEAILSGHDPYTFGPCGMCNGTGKTN